MNSVLMVVVGYFLGSAIYDIINKREGYAINLLIALVLFIVVCVIKASKS